MGNIISNTPEEAEEVGTSTDVDDKGVLYRNVVLKPTLQEKLANLPSAWNPAFNEFQFGDSPENINSNLPTQFISLKWENMPQAAEFPLDVVKYIWVKLSDFRETITKFIPPNTTINERSYICFLFVDQKLFYISIRLFHDGTHRNYNDIIEAYAKAVNTPVIETTEGKEFSYEDNRIIYCSRIHSDKSHILIEVIRKGQISNDHVFPHLSVPQQRRKSSIEPLISPQPYKYDIMISYCHKDKDLCHQIYYRLLKDKYRVWIDLENMYGPLVERMAEAIENSQFVLICMSEAYKSSTYCQLEAEYAFKFQTSLIPLVVKKDFTQTGWLGMLCGLRTHIDFTKTTFDMAYEKLCTEIRHYQTQTTKAINSSTQSE